MQIKNIQIFSSQTAADGAWVDVSNLVNLSLQVNGIEGNVWIEVSDDPNAPINGTGIGAPGSAPTLLQFPSQPGSTGSSSTLPAGTLYVKTTFITKWGETTASAESTIAMTAGNYLWVQPPVPSAAQAPYVTGYNVYVGLATNTEVLQTAPQYQPQRNIDGIGSVNILGGGTVNPQTTQSTRYAISGALPLAQPFQMTMGYQNTGITPPGADASGGAAAGIKLQSTLVGATSSNNINYAITGTNCMVNPSGLCWKWLRVRKDSTSVALTTTAWLLGQNG